MSRHRIVGLGEILWDIFPDGPRFGGAPSNFACSTAELAPSTADVFMVSGVGHDQLGRQAIEALQTHGVQVTGVQLNSYDTGQVNVQIDGAGVASYHFAEDSAWDHLTWTADLEQLANTCDAVCFGTLGQRQETTQATMQTFVSSVRMESLRILDINLRPPYVSDPIILASLKLANVLKLNDEELPYVARLCSLSGSEIEMLQQLTDQYRLRCVALTRGANGAVIMCDGQVSELSGQRVDVVDTVGAGDAFTAALTLGMLTGDDAETINCRSIEAATYVCSQSGATPTFPDHLRASL